MPHRCSSTMPSSCLTETDYSWINIQPVYEAAMQRKRLTGKSRLSMSALCTLKEAQCLHPGKLFKFFGTHYTPWETHYVSFAAQQFIDFSTDYYEGAKANKLEFTDHAVFGHELCLTEYLRSHPAELWASNPETETRHHSARARAAVAKAARAAARAEARARSKAEAKAAAEAEEAAAVAAIAEAEAAAAAAAEDAAQAAAVARMGQAVRGWSVKSQQQQEWCQQQRRHQQSAPGGVAPVC